MSWLALDLIIFGLQRFGGISNFWMRLLEATGRSDLPGGIELLMPRSLLVQEALDVTGKVICTEALSPRLSRYLPAHVPTGAAIFHTSYYRRPRRRVDRYIASVYDFTYERYFNGLPRAVHHLQKGASIQAADMSVCISEATRADLLSYFPKVDPARTCVVPLGVDRSRFHPERGTYDGAPYILFVGQRAGYKRFDLAVDALALAPELTLAIVGPPVTNEERALLEQALPGRWIRHENVFGDALRRLYSDAYAFIFPSDYEGFGLPILEAMACGCPTVAAKRSSFPEVAGDAALLAVDQTAEAYAHLLTSLENETLRTQLVMAGTRRATLFDWERTFSCLWKCYE